MVKANPFARLDEYELRQLAVHLEKGGREDELHRVLALEWDVSREDSSSQQGIQSGSGQFSGRESLEQRPQYKNAWYEIREQRGDIEGYLADVQRAWELAKRCSIGEQSDEKLARAISLQCRYALCTASIGRLAGNIPANLLAALVKREIWLPTRAVVYAERLPTEAQRAKALAALAPHLRDPLIWRALTAARLLADTYTRVETLQAFLPHLPEAERPALLAEVLAAILKLPLPLGRAELFAALVPLLTAEERAALLAETLEVVRVDTKGDYHEGPLVTLAPYLSEAQLHDALDIVETSSQEGAKANALVRLAPYLPEPLIRRALAQVRSFADLYKLQQAVALAGLAPYLPEIERMALIDEARAAIHLKKEAHSEKIAILTLLAALTPQLSEAQRLPLLDELLKVVDDLEYSGYQAEALEKLAPYLLPSLLDEALHKARKIDFIDDVFRALLGLIPYLPEAQRPSILEEALETARKAGLNPVVARLVHSPAEALTMVAALLPEQEQDKVLEEALSLAQIVHDAYDHEAEMLLAELAISLASSGARGEAIAVAASISEQTIWVTAIEGMTPHLAESQLNELVADERARDAGPIRARVLMAVAPHLSEQERASKMVEALEAAQAYVSEQFLEAFVSDEKLVRKAFALSQAAKGNLLALRVLGPHLPEELLRQALQGVRSIDRAYDKARMLICLAPNLSVPLLHSAVDIAKELIYVEKPGDRMEVMMANIDARPWALGVLAPQLARLGAGQDALIAVREIDETGYEGNYQSRALLDMARDLSEQSLYEALNIARAMKDDRMRGKTLAELAPFLPQEERAAVIAEARESVGRIPSNYVDRLPVLMELRSSMTQAELVQEAMASVQAFQATPDRSGDRRLSQAARFLAEIGAYEQALTVVQDNTRGNERLGTLASIVPYLATPVLQSVLQIAEETVDDVNKTNRDDLFVAVAFYLAKSGSTAEAVDIVQRIGQQGYRRNALKAIVPFAHHLSLPPLYSVWRKSLHEFALRGRKDLLADLHVLVPVIVRLGGTEGMKEICSVIQRVILWWP